MEMLARMEAPTSARRHFECRRLFTEVTRSLFGVKREMPSGCVCAPEPAIWHLHYSYWQMKLPSIDLNYKENHHSVEKRPHAENNALVALKVSNHYPDGE